MLGALVAGKKNLRSLGPSGFEFVGSTLETFGLRGATVAVARLVPGVYPKAFNTRLYFCRIVVKVSHRLIILVQDNEATPYPVSRFCIWLFMYEERRLRLIEDEIDLRTI